MEKKRLYNPEEIILIEDEALKKRREQLFSKEDAEKLETNRFGIAMSGGGIRSATINLGFLKTLNKFGILKKADYLSTVSGGGYCGSYVQTTLKNLGSYESLFDREHIDYMRRRGSYLVPGKGVWKLWNQLVLIVAFLASWVMSLVSPGIVFLLVYGGLRALGVVFKFDSNDFSGKFDNYFLFSALAVSALVFINYVVNVLFKYDLDWSLKFHRFQTALIAGGIFGVAVIAVLSLAGIEAPNPQSFLLYSLLALGLIVLGFFTSPNASSFHRFYRNQLADAFLNFAGVHKNVLLHNLFEENKTEKDILAPYPLVNTCLNLQSDNDPKFKGTKTSDFFLLSPKFCGSKLTGYVRTDQPEGFSKMTFPAATTISAAAVNPGMGIYSNKLLAVLTTIFNARLGYWAWNPLKTKGRIPIVWWPFYFFYELFSTIGTDKKMLNISDGGHIENLAVYELLRRKCRLILGVDAGEDSKYSFVDLETLTVRARNELGIEIKFREGETPEELIRPQASHGYSKRRYAVADLLTIWEEFLIENEDGSLFMMPLSRNDENGSPIQKPVEALVNYKYNDNKKVTFTIHLKFDGAFLKNEDYKELENRVREKINFKLDVEKSKMYGFQKLKFGTFVYVKSSITAPKGKPPISRDDDLKFGTYKYKIYHPNFPHEPTSDQFFDEVQWESYFQLGQFIGAEMLQIPNFLAYHSDEKEGKQKEIEELINWFDKAQTMFKGEGGPLPADLPRSRGTDAPTKRTAAAPTVQYEM